MPAPTGDAIAPPHSHERSVNPILVDTSVPALVTYAALALLGMDTAGILITTAVEIRLNAGLIPLFLDDGRPSRHATRFGVAHLTAGPSGHDAGLAPPQPLMRCGRDSTSTNRRRRRGPARWAKPARVTAPDRGSHRRQHARP